MPFDAGQGRPQAVVDAVAEGQVAVVAAEDVEAAGVGELPRVAVGGALHGPDALPPPQGLSSQFEVGCHHPGNALDGAVVAQAFLDQSAAGGSVMRVPSGGGPLLSGTSDSGWGMLDPPLPGAWPGRAQDFPFPSHRVSPRSAALVEAGNARLIR